MVNIINLFEQNFIVGTYAWYKKYNACRVIAVDGKERTIKVAHSTLEGGVIFKIYEVLVEDLENIDDNFARLLSGKIITIPLEEGFE